MLESRWLRGTKPPLKRWGLGIGDGGEGEGEGATKAPSRVPGPKNPKNLKIAKIKPH